MREARNEKSLVKFIFIIEGYLYLLYGKVLTVRVRVRVKGVVLAW